MRMTVKKFPAALPVGELFDILFCVSMVIADMNTDRG